MAHPSDSEPIVHIRLKPDEYQRIRAIAKADDRSAAYVIRNVIRAWLAQHQPKGSQSS